jgi:hypothetical protein
MICARQQRPHFTIAQSKPAPSLCSAPYPPPPPTGMAQFRDKDRAALHCTAMRRFEPARTPYPHQPMIPTSSPRPGRGCAEDLLKRRNTRVAVAFRHGRNLGRMIGHAQRPRYVAIVLLSFFLTPIVSALPPRYFGPRPSLLTVDFTPSSTPSFYTFTIQAFLVHFPHFRAGTTLTFTFVIPPAPTRPSVTLQQLSSAHHHH